MSQRSDRLRFRLVRGANEGQTDIPPLASLMKLFVLAVACSVSLASLSGAEPLTLNLWPGKPPGETNVLPPEGDQTKDSDRLVGGRRIIKLGHVSTPQIAMYRPSKD